MDGFVRLLRDILIDAKIPDECIAIDKRVELPGWFRAEKKWDMVIVHKGELLAALEFKSQIGPSFGNNFNNRSEEALGSATDIWAAYREGAFETVNAAPSRIFYAAGRLRAVQSTGSGSSAALSSIRGI